jgi:hypothetical protein
MNIETAFKEFLIEKQQILNTEQQKDYEEVIDLFTQFLNSCAYLGLDTEDAKLFDNLYNTADKEFCDIFGPDYIGTYDVEEFLGDYMLREVLTDVDFLKTSVKIISELIDWLHLKNIMNDEDYNESVNILYELKYDVPTARELAILLIEYIKSHPVNKYTEELSGDFLIDEIEPGIFWLSEDLVLGQALGPVIVSQEITEKAKVGWTICATVGKTDKVWKPIGVAYVYLNPTSEE